MPRRALRFLSVLVLLAVVGASCPARAGDEAILSTGIGAALGGLFGSQIGHGGGQLFATGTGAAIGGLIGNNVGHSIEAEESHHNFSYDASSYAYAPPMTYGFYPPPPTYVAPPAPPPIYVDQEAQTYCRPYSQQIIIDGQTQESYGTACLEPDGTWRIMP